LDARRAAKHGSRMQRDSGIEAVIFDWAGTTVDHGCMSPIAPFVAVFAKRGVTISPETARGPMGTHKRTHIERLAALPEVAAAWKKANGRAPSSADVDAMFADFVPLQLSVLPGFAEPIAGCVEVVSALRARGVRIGSTTGYTRAMMDVLAPEAQKRGFAPDVIVCADEVKRARPFPDMALRNVLDLGVSSVRACVKVDDTVAGIEEGIRAGMWTVGVVMTGNELGRAERDLAAMDPKERGARRAAGYARLRAAGADVVIDGIAELPSAIATIEARMVTPRAA
jgi:phosphonoacetaldehyde hydrolase